MVFNPVTTHSSPVLLICNFSCAALGWRRENVCCVYELILELSPRWDTAAWWHRWGATEAMAKPSIIFCFPGTQSRGIALPWSAKDCEAPRHRGVQRGVICSHGLPIFTDAWVFCEGLTFFEDSSRTLLADQALCLLLWHNLSFFIWYLLHCLQYSHSLERNVRKCHSLTFWSKLFSVLWSRICADVWV